MSVLKRSPLSTGCKKVIDRQQYQERGELDPVINNGEINFCTPSYKLDRIDNKELRDKILSISYTEWKKLGFSKGTLHQLKEKAKSDKPFKLQKRVKDKLMTFYY